jgi:hypothetical protein
MFMKITKEKKGVAGLEIFLSVIAMVFVIGIIIMAFQLTGAKLMDSTTDADAINVINETKQSVGEASSWFGIFITIAAVVVLILLIVLIIVSLRGAGLMGGGQMGG